MNLLANAVKFTASGGVHIHLGLEAHAVSAPGIGADRVHLRIAVLHAHLVAATQAC